MEADAKAAGCVGRGVQPVKAQCILVALLGLVASLAGCARKEMPPEWAGRWTGPEGTYLDIAGSDGRYTVTIRNLDAARTFEASVAEAGLVFERDGVRESIRATNGDATGMKWLAGKANCLTIRTGEGYCRD
jgi:hypothetical protein